MRIPEALKNQIKTDAFARSRQRNIEQTANLHLYDEVLEVGQKLKAGPLETKIEKKTAFVFVDLMPNYNWAHACLILLYDTEKGQLYKTLEARFPPTVMEQKPANVEAFHMPVKQIDTQKERLAKKVSGLGNLFRTAITNRYAILFSGNSNNRHLNDLEFLYRTLIDVYGFFPENIYTLNYDGTLNYKWAPNPIGNWPGDNTPYRLSGHINGPGTQQTMESALDAIAAKIKSDDLLFIHTNDHGAGPGDGVDDYCLCTYDLTHNSSFVPYYVSSFVAKLKSLPQFGKLMVMMEQCRSGGFVDPIINNSPAKQTHVAAAVQASGYSLAGVNFDPFAEDWIAGVTGRYQSGAILSQTVDSNNDGRISAAEAFNYANAVRHQGDLPTFADKPSGDGSYMFLGLSSNDLIIKKHIVDNEVIQKLIRRPIPEALNQKDIVTKLSKTVQR
jgi:hypothetical protein